MGSLFSTFNFQVPLKFGLAWLTAECTAKVVITAAKVRIRADILSPGV
jgi:hypothetical protein